MSIIFHSVPALDRQTDRQTELVKQYRAVRALRADARDKTCRVAFAVSQFTKRLESYGGVAKPSYCICGAATPAECRCQLHGTVAAAGSYQTLLCRSGVSDYHNILQLSSDSGTIDRESFKDVSDVIDPASSSHRFRGLTCYTSVMALICFSYDARGT